MVVNYSKDSEYHSQRNNRLIPHSSCNATSMIMALKQAGVRLPFPEKYQPEDYLSLFLQSDQVKEKMKELAPWALDPKTGKQLYPPQEVHVVMEWAVNTLLNKQVVIFSTKTPFQKIINHIDNRKGVVLSGRFPLNNTTIDHMISLAGYMKHQGSISYILIDDPYGDYKTSYRSHRGNNIPLPIEEAQTILKPVGLKDRNWAYLVG
jgi:Peptidase_C39 like family